MWRKQAEAKPSPAAEPASPSQSFTSPPASAPAEPPRGRESSGAGDASRISKALSIRGEVTGRDALLIEGEVEGNIRVEGATVTVGPGGRVTGDIEAREIEVQGTVQGTLRGNERVHIGRTGALTGDASTPRLAVDEGAVLRGRVEVVRPGEALDPPSAPKAAGKSAPVARTPALHAVGADSDPPA